MVLYRRIPEQLEDLANPIRDSGLKATLQVILKRGWDYLIINNNRIEGDSQLFKVGDKLLEVLE